MALTQEMLEENWENSCREISTNGKKKIIFHQMGSLMLGVMSCDDDTSAYLRRLLHLFFDLMQFRVKINQQSSFYNKNMCQGDIQKYLQVYK